LSTTTKVKIGHPNAAQEYRGWLNGEAFQCTTNYNARRQLEARSGRSVGVEQEPFVWTFPTFVLARNYTKDARTGIIDIDDDAIEFFTPEQHIALFTDSHLAQECLQQLSPDLGLSILTIPTPIALKNLLLKGRNAHEWVAVDPNPKTRIARLVSLADVLAAIEEHLDG
jgi:hypothetical protein